MLPKPMLTIHSTTGSVSSLRSRVVRERLLPAGTNTWALVREVFEAYSEPGEVVVQAIDIGEVVP